MCVRVAVCVCVCVCAYLVFVYMHGVRSQQLNCIIISYLKQRGFEEWEGEREELEG